MRFSWFILVVGVLVMALAGNAFEVVLSRAANKVVASSVEEVTVDWWRVGEAVGVVNAWDFRQSSWADSQVWGQVLDTREPAGFLIYIR